MSISCKEPTGRLSADGSLWRLSRLNDLSMTGRFYFRCRFIGVRCGRSPDHTAGISTEATRVRIPSRTRPLVAGVLGFVIRGEAFVA